MGQSDERVIPGLCDEIRLKYVAVEKNPEYHLKLDRIIKSADSVNNLYSWWIEHPDMRQLLLVATDKPKIIRNVRVSARDGAERLSGAWKELNAETHDLQHTLDHKLTIRAAGMVEPKNRFYRTGDADIRWMDRCPNGAKDNSAEIQGVMDDFFSRLRLKEDPIEAAIYTHLMVAAIQPFVDGNKRTARLLQNKMLRDVGMPPIVVPPGEREAYMTTLYDAILACGLHREPSGHYNLFGPTSTRAMKPFFAYMGGKLNTLFDDIIGDLHVPYNGKKH